MKPKHESTWPNRGLIVAHPASLLPEDKTAFLHAVALARTSQSKLLSIHADGGGPDGERGRIPLAADALAGWGALPAGAREGDEAKLGMSHERIAHECCEDPVDTLLDALKNAEPDLLVATTSARKGVARLLFGSVAEALALHVKAPALLFPVESRGFLADGGAPVLQRILVAAGDHEASALGAARAAWLAEVAGTAELEIVLVYVGSANQAPPPYAPPERAGVRYRFRHVEGSPTDAILTEADGFRADVVVMATRGHDSIADLIGGSHMERVLREARCPVLSVPLA